jgi:Ca-activated chloride channel homolog
VTRLPAAWPARALSGTALAAWVSAVTMLSAQGQNATFSSRVEAVRVDVLVTEDGKPVRGLRAADFEIFDNGVRQAVDIVSVEQLPLNVVFTFDLSSSIVGERLGNLREASHTVVDGLKADDQAALVMFNTLVNVSQGLTSDTRLVKAAIDRANPAGNTSLVDASFAGMMLAESDVGRGLVIVFSDGLDTSSWLRPRAVLDVARRSDAVVYAVSAGQARRAEFLGDLTEQTGGRLFKIESTRSLSEVFLEVLNEFRQRYLLSYSPAGVSPGGWHTLTVRVKGRSSTVKARPGYLAGQ